MHTYPGIPLEVWRRARQNALLSDLSFREYCIRVLAECEPFPREAEIISRSSQSSLDHVSMLNRGVVYNGNLVG